MRLGIFSKAFPTADVEACFAQVVAAGYPAVQFNFASAGLPPLPSAIPDAALTTVLSAKQRHGVTFFHDETCAVVRFLVVAQYKANLLVIIIEVFLQ